MRVGFKRLAIELHKPRSIKAKWKPNSNNGKYWIERLQCGIQIGFITVFFNVVC